MIPPADSNVLSTNLKFDALYRDLCTTKLNADGTSKVDTKSQNTVGEELHRARVAKAKKDLIKGCLSGLAYRGNDLPEDLQELVAVVAAAIDSELQADDTLLLRSDVEKFKDNIEPISDAVSQELKAHSTSLLALTPEEARTDGLTLTSYIRETQARIATSEANIGLLRLQFAQEAAVAQQLYYRVFETSVRILEQTIHGAVARNTKAKADYLATVAEGMHKKLLLQQRQLTSQTQSPELQDAAKARLQDLDAESLTLRRKVREAEEKVAEYGKAKALAGVASEYAEILSEMARVQADVDRLRDGK